MRFLFIIPPNFVWFQGEQSNNATGWILGIAALILLVIVISWFASRNQRAREKQLDALAKDAADSKISGAIPQTGTEFVAPAESTVVAVPEEPSMHEESPEHPVHKGDDLTLIEGVGPAMEEILNGAGIYTYENLANADPNILKDLLSDIGLESVDPTEWPTQAKLAAMDRWDDLEQMKRQFRGQIE